MTEIFVFGSNLQGIHGAGAAKTAHLDYGAKIGTGIGRTGNAYAIPTKKRPTHKTRQFTINEIASFVDDFVAYATQHSQDTFILTRIGCGLAGYTEEEIGPLFAKAPQNVQMPDCWQQYRNTENGPAVDLFFNT